MHAKVLSIAKYSLIMPRRITKTESSRFTPTETITVQNTSFFTRMQQLLRNERLHYIAGLCLLGFGLFMLIADISFFWTGKNDFSVLEMSHAEQVAHRGEIENVTGLPGARLSAFMINGAFGWASLWLVVMAVLYGLQLLRKVSLNGWKVFFCSAFGLVWVSLLCGFVQDIMNSGSFFRWGGAHGDWLAQWLTSYIHAVGTILVLALSAAVFGVVVDRHFMARIRLMMARWRNKPADTSALSADNEKGNKENADEEAVVIDLTEESQKQEDGQPKEDDDIVLVIEDTTASDGPTESASVPEAGESEDQPSDPDLEIESGQAVEIAEDDPDYLIKKYGPYDPRKDLENYRFPALNLLKEYDNETSPVIDNEEQQANSRRIVATLRNYGVEIETIKATVGPTVTLYEVVPKAGVKISRIQSLESDIMLSLAAKGIRIIAPMPGKGTVGIEVPNEKPQTVSIHSLIASKRFQEERKMRLPIAIGRTITNEVFMFDLAKTPHLLVAGATGQGKSVAINAIIASLLYKKHPAELKMVLVDPKKVEFAPYRALMRHYLAAMPGVEDRDIIITDCQKVIDTLNSLVIEMEDRYELLEDAGVRNMEDYNEKFVNRRLNPDKLVADRLHHRFLPYIVIVIDEYGDFIMQAGKQVETPIARITQKARAVGMHMILATQRPSVNIVTGVIKANIPTRIALRTQSVVDSRTVLDAKGADQLIGKGDMLYSGGGETTRIQCAFIDTPEVDNIVEHVQQQQHYFEPYQLPEYVSDNGDSDGQGPVDTRRLDPMFAEVARYVVNKQEGSTSRLQRVFQIGYNRAGKLSDQLEAAGIVGPNKGSKGRDVLISDPARLEELLQTLNA